MGSVGCGMRLGDCNPPMVIAASMSKGHQKKICLMRSLWGAKCGLQGDVIRLSPEIAKNKDGRVIIMVGEIEYYCP
jgi:hypothetical protein